MKTSKETLFLGYTAARGVYLINTVTNKIRAIHESTDIIQAKTSIAWTTAG
jgi:hypothetical protein